MAAFARYRVVEATWRALTEPVGAWLFHAAALWAWHLPVLFAAAVLDDDVHALQHATFLAAALCFWWSVLQPRGRPGGAGLASVFTTMLHTGALGALLTFAPRPWYTVYEATGRYGLTLLEDQQLGGLVMWVPGGLAYLVAAIHLAAHLLRNPRDSARSAAPREASAPPWPP
jgi:putative membrane protein